jgi:hypothetical protein
MGPFFERVPPPVLAALSQIEMGNTQRNQSGGTQCPPSNAVVVKTSWRDNPALSDGASGCRAFGLGRGLPAFWRASEPLRGWFYWVGAGIR